MKTRSGPNGGTFRVRGIRPAEKVTLERLDDYLAGLVASGEIDQVRYAEERRAIEAETKDDPDKIVEPVKIATEGLRWAVARVSPGAERRVARQLTHEGFSAYCPLGRRLTLQGRVVVNGVKTRRRVMRQFAVFAPYVFVGVGGDREIGREICDHWGERVGVVIGDASGPSFIAPRIIAGINALEVAGQWWDDWRGQTKLKRGQQVLVTAGPFRDMRGIIEALPAEMRVTVNLGLFGGAAAVTLDACQVAPV